MGIKTKNMNNGLDVMMYDRSLNIFLNCLGERVEINLINKTKYQGLMHSFDPISLGFVLLFNPQIYNSELKKYKYLTESHLKISFGEISQMKLIHNKLQKFSKADFQTDVDISKKNFCEYFHE